MRALHDRLRTLEQSTTLRAGDWVLFTDPTNGHLMMARPGEPVAGVAGEEPPEQLDLSGARGFIIQDVTNAVWSGVRQEELDGNKTLEEMAAALGSIPPSSVVGVNGGSSLTDTFYETWTQLWGGLAQGLGGGEIKSVQDAANAAANVASNAGTALQLGEWTYAVQQLRNNKTLMSGVDESEESNFMLDTLYPPGSTEPYVTVPVTSAGQPMSFWRATETAKKGFVSWFGKGITNVTALYLDIYKFDYATNTVTLLHTSPNQIGQATANWGYLIYNIPLANRITVNAGDVLGVAWRVVGTGTHSIAGKTIASPPHPTVVPAKTSARRTDGVAGPLSFAALTPLYANDVPWFGIGILSGDAPPAYFAPRQTEISATGPYTYEIPPWANYIDHVFIGGGGGGCGGHPINTAPGEGGDAGVWVTETLVRGVDFPVNATQITGVVGVGGNGGPGNTPGQPGTSTQRNAIPGGKAALMAAGGAAGDTQSTATTGESSGDITYNGVTYSGGVGGKLVGVSNGGPGSAPGAGGAGGAGGTWGSSWPGGKGARGGCWYTARQS